MFDRVLIMPLGFTSRLPPLQNDKFSKYVICSSGYDFFFHRKVMFHSQDIQVFVFLTILWFTKSVTSWWALVHETGCIFEYIFRTTTHKVTKLGQLIDVNKGNYFQESFEQFGELGLSSRILSIYQPLQWFNQLCQDSSVSFFGMVNKGIMSTTKNKW